MMAHHYGRKLFHTLWKLRLCERIPMIDHFVNMAIRQQHREIERTQGHERRVRAAGKRLGV